MMTLCRISTGEGWPAVLQSVVEGLQHNHTDVNGEFVEGDDLVRISAPLFFLSFIVLSDFFFFNLLATIVIDQYDSVEDTADEVEGMNLAVAMLRFKEAWEARDPHCTGTLTTDELVELIIELPQPIGAPRVTILRVCAFAPAEQVVFAALSTPLSGVSRVCRSLRHWR